MHSRFWFALLAGCRERKNMKNYDPCYLKGEYIGFPRRDSFEDDILMKADSITGVKPDPMNEDFSIVLYSNREHGLRAFEPAKNVARTLWGKGNFKKKKGVYIPK